jgi:hypothetical protein
MAITGIGNYQSNLYQNPYISNKSQVTEKSELENAKSSNVSDYSDYLSKKYNCVKNGNVAISEAYLKECAKNTDKAKELEQNLSFYNESYQNGYASAKANASVIGAKLVDYSESWSIDSTGNVTMIASTTVTSGNDVKGWKELKEEQTKRLENKKVQQKKEEAIKQKRQEQKQIQQMRIEKAKNKNNNGNINLKI